MSQRISTLAKLPSRNIVYDLFCDHGQIGLTLLKSNSQVKVIFNDVIDELIEKIKYKIDAQNFSDRVTYLSIDARNILFEENSTIILAGVGEDLMIDVLKRVPKSCELIINTRFNPIKLRKYLILNWKLNSEFLFKEASQLFEILVLSKEGRELSLFNSFIKKTDPLGQEYLSELINFAQTKSQWDSEWLGYLHLLQTIETSCPT